MLACLYNSLMFSMLISVLLFQNTWLEMRINIGCVFFTLVFFLFIIQVFNRNLRKICGTFSFAVFSFIASYMGIYFILGIDRLKIIPASIIRDGIMQNNIPFAYINYVMIAITFAGLSAVFFTRKK